MLCEIKTHVEHANHVKFMVLPSAAATATAAQPAAQLYRPHGILSVVERLKAKKRKVSCAFVSY